MKLKTNCLHHLTKHKFIGIAVTKTCTFQPIVRRTYLEHITLVILLLSVQIPYPQSAYSIRSLSDSSIRFPESVPLCWMLYKKFQRLYNGVNLMQDACIKDTLALLQNISHLSIKEMRSSSTKTNQTKFEL